MLATALDAERSDPSGDPLSADSFLSSVVEVAIGMAGFAGIVAAIRQRALTRWPPEQRLLLEMLVVASAAAITFAFLPIVLAEAGLAPSRIWRIGSASLIAWYVGIAVFRIRQVGRTSVAVPLGRSFAAWVVFLTVLQALNLGLGLSWPYLVGIFGLLANGFIFFLRLLLRDVEEATETS